MRNEAFATKALNFASNLCIFVYFATNIVFVLLNYVNPFSFAIITLPFKALFSFTGFIAVAGIVATKVSSHFLVEQGQGAWKQISIAIIVLIAILLISPIQEPAQWWLYAAGIMTFMITILALSSALLAIGPVIVRFLGSIVMLGALVFAGGVVFLGFSNYSLADQTLKRGNVDTPQKAIRALDSISRSVAMENGANGFQPVQRNCSNSDVVCAANVQIYDIPRIKRTLGLAEADWNETSANNVDVHRVQNQNLDFILAQGYGKTNITVANLSEIDESDWTKLNFSAPTPGN